VNLPIHTFVNRQCLWSTLFRSDPMAGEAVRSARLPPKSTWAAFKRFMRGARFSHVQAVVGTLAGIVSITSAAFSVVRFARPSDTGDLVAIVQAAGSHQSVPDATVEVFTSQNALVAMLRPDATGRVTQELKEGVYVVRVSHPRYSAEVHRVQVQPRRTVELRTSLRAGASSPIERAVNNGVGALRRAFHF
jgi:Carboxypeptidase regulatory-like domain